MSDSRLCWTRNAHAVAISEIPLLEQDDWRSAVIDTAGNHGHITAVMVLPDQGRDRGQRQVLAAVARDAHHDIGLTRTWLETTYPALTPHCSQAHLFERELAESWGFEPLGHPWLKPVRYPVRRHDGQPASPQLLAGVIDPYLVQGDEVHEVAVGPVHAGVIEPGHFRFQCHGERVFNLEIALGYQHRGIETSLPSCTESLALHRIETVAGDSSVAYATTWCQALEALAGWTAPSRADLLRCLALELERTANHVGDLGALAGDVAFLPTASFCGRIRGDYLNLTAELCGNRFGRGLVVPGGVAWNVDRQMIDFLHERLRVLFKDIRGAAELLFETPSVMARFERTGTVSHQDAVAVGLVGVAARASGRPRDVRKDFPTGAWATIHAGSCVRYTGDVLARAAVRWAEIQRSHHFMNIWLERLASEETDTPIAHALPPLRKEQLVVSLVEGWRGEITQVLMTDSTGCLSACKIVDPSFHNWTGLSLALRGEQISDFPLCNKSFNLSYCGFDL